MLTYAKRFGSQTPIHPAPEGAGFPAIFDKAYKVTKVALEHAKYMLHQAVAVAISLKKAILKKVTTLGILVAQTGALFIALKHAYIDHLTKHKLAFFNAMKDKLKTVHQVVNDLIYACLRFPKTTGQKRLNG